MKESRSMARHGVQRTMRARRVAGWWAGAFRE